MSSGPSSFKSGARFGSVLSTLAQDLLGTRGMMGRRGPLPVRSSVVVAGIGCHWGFGIGGFGEAAEADVPTPTEPPPDFRFGETAEADDLESLGG